MSAKHYRGSRRRKLAELMVLLPHGPVVQSSALAPAESKLGLGALRTEHVLRYYLGRGRTLERE